MVLIAIYALINSFAMEIRLNMKSTCQRYVYKIFFFFFFIIYKLVCSSFLVSILVH